MKLLNLLEATDVYEGGDPDSLDAWIKPDVSKTENGRIYLTDNFGSYEWDQNKSNLNIEGKSLHGSGEGKGFSFYFARYAFRDSNRIPVSSTNKNTYSGFLSRIQFDWILPYLKDPSVKSRLSPGNAVLMLFYKEDTTNTIISATYTTKKEHFNAYKANAVVGMMRETMRTYTGNKNISEEKLDEYIEYQKNEWFYKSLEKDLILKLPKVIKNGTKEFKQLLRII
jgi:hypothetical protein